MFHSGQMIDDDVCDVDDNEDGIGIMMIDNYDENVRLTPSM